MPGRKQLQKNDKRLKIFNAPIMMQRRKILSETVDSFQSDNERGRYFNLANENLLRWKFENKSSIPTEKIKIMAGDWGDVTLELTKKYGECFAVLNMANAYVPGGGYVEGMSAQEENMYRRTDCHFCITEEVYDRSLDRYRPFMTELISAKNGEVYLDTDNPRICIRGSEDVSSDDLGYRWLQDDEIFPFYELRAAAQDLRGDKIFDLDDARRRIVAQLDTLIKNNIRYAVLGAFGCGAFENPIDIIASLYKEEISKRIEQFDIIAFALYGVNGSDVPYKVFMGTFGSQNDTL